MMILFICFVSCKKDVITEDVGYNYFPDKVGKYVIYDVDSSYQDDPSNLKTNVKFRVKEVIESTYTDNQGRPTLRIERYKKLYDPLVSYDSKPWVLSDVWSANRTAATAEKVEENVRFIKLAFPTKKNKKWDGNAYNTIQGWDNYKIISTDISDVVNNISFDSVTTVLQSNIDNLVTTTYGMEKYAKNIGMVYKKIVEYNKQKQNDSLFVYDDTTGYQYTMNVVSYGN